MRVLQTFLFTTTFSHKLSSKYVEGPLDSIKFDKAINNDPLADHSEYDEILNDLESKRQQKILMEQKSPLFTPKATSNIQKTANNPHVENILQFHPSLLLGKDLSHPSLLQENEDKSHTEKESSEASKPSVGIPVQSTNSLSMSIGAPVQNDYMNKESSPIKEQPSENVSKTTESKKDPQTVQTEPGSASQISVTNKKTFIEDDGTSAVSVGGLENPSDGGLRSDPKIKAKDDDVEDDENDNTPLENPDSVLAIKSKSKIKAKDEDGEDDENDNTPLENPDSVLTIKSNFLKNGIREHNNKEPVQGNKENQEPTKQMAELQKQLAEDTTARSKKEMARGFRQTTLDNDLSMSVEADGRTLIQKKQQYA